MIIKTENICNYLTNIIKIPANILDFPANEKKVSKKDLDILSCIAIEFKTVMWSVNKNSICHLNNKPGFSFSRFFRMKTTARAGYKLLNAWNKILNANHKPLNIPNNMLNGRNKPLSAANKPLNVKNTLLNGWNKRLNVWNKQLNRPHNMLNAPNRLPDELKKIKRNIALNH